MPRLWGRGTPGHTVVAVLDKGEEPLVQDMGESGAGQLGGSRPPVYNHLYHSPVL